MRKVKEILRWLRKVPKPVWVPVLLLILIGSTSFYLLNLDSYVVTFAMGYVEVTAKGADGAPYYEYGRVIPEETTTVILPVPGRIIIARIIVGRPAKQVTIQAPIVDDGLVHVYADGSFISGTAELAGSAEATESHEHNHESKDSLLTPDQLHRMLPPSKRGKLL